eukprot:TRINITY_DN7617_c0_g1_i2.p1 TRINITY_DN7617_c0_g1~~TRINITY_DN7617_c0_g1_i2.p1  ORF type:complete len:431 (-),score=69.15 TRINITY_DN7617_c0_g1_i2:178-1470(-)
MDSYSHAYSIVEQVFDPDETDPFEYSPCATDIIEQACQYRCYIAAGLAVASFGCGWIGLWSGCVLFAVSAGLFILSIFYNQWVLSTGDEDERKRRWIWNELVVYGCLTTFSFTCWYYDGSNIQTLCRLLSTLTPPFCISRVCTTWSSAYGALAVHVLLFAYLAMSWDNEGLLQIQIAQLKVPEGLQYAVALVVINGLCYDDITTRFRLQKYYHGLALKAGHSTYCLLEDLCDAVVTLDVQWRMITPSPRLAAMLSRSDASLLGRELRELISPDDRDRFTAHLQEIQQTVKEYNAARNPTPTSYGKSIQMKLLDTYNSVVQVHLFHVAILKLNNDPVFIIGISEAWNKDKKQDSSKKKERRSFRPAGSGTQAVTESGVLRERMTSEPKPKTLADVAQEEGLIPPGVRIHKGVGGKPSLVEKLRSKPTPDAS